MFFKHKTQLNVCLFSLTEQDKDIRTELNNTSWTDLPRYALFLFSFTQNLVRAAKQTGLKSIPSGLASDILLQSKIYSEVEKVVSTLIRGAEQVKEQAASLVMLKQMQQSSDFEGPLRAHLTNRITAICPGIGKAITAAAEPEVLSCWSPR